VCITCGSVFVRVTGDVRDLDVLGRARPAASPGARDLNIGIAEHVRAPRPRRSRIPAWSAAGTVNARGSESWKKLFDVASDRLVDDRPAQPVRHGTSSLEVALPGAGIYHLCDVVTSGADAQHRRRGRHHDYPSWCRLESKGLFGSTLESGAS